MDVLELLEKNRREADLALPYFTFLLWAEVFSLESCPAASVSCKLIFLLFHFIFYCLEKEVFHFELLPEILAIPKGFVFQ